MRTLKKTVAALVMLVPVAAAAQENINKAIDEFGSDVSRNGIKMSRLEKDTTKAYARTYRFVIPKKNEDRLGAIKKAFYRDAADAYEIFTKDEMEHSKKNMRIAYGDNLEKSFTIGWPFDKAGKNYMFMLFDDNEDSRYRYAYGLEWEKAGKNIEGTLMKIYSLNPKKVGNIKKVKQLRKDFFSKTNSLLGDSLKIPGFGGIDINEEDDRVVLKSEGGTIIVSKDGVYMDDGKGKTTVVGDGVKAFSDEIADDPITKFNNLRASYMNNIREGNVDNTTLLTGLANYMLKFCKTYGKKMSADERQLCIEGLQEMQEQTPDKYIKGIFGLSIKNMK